MNPMGKQYLLLVIFFLLCSLIFTSVLYVTARPLLDEPSQVNQMSPPTKLVMTFKSSPDKGKRSQDLHKTIGWVKHSGPSPGEGHKIVHAANHQ